MISMVDPTPSVGGAGNMQEGADQNLHAQERGLSSPLECARNMAWFGIGLGVAEFLTRGLVSSLTGVQNKKLIRLYGLREIICSVGILNSERPANWMWARLAGDVMDFASVLEAIASNDTDRKDEAAMALVGVAGAAFTDAACAMMLSEES